MTVAFEAAVRLGLLIEPNRPWQDTDLLTQPPSPNYWALEVPRRAA